MSGFLILVTPPGTGLEECQRANAASIGALLRKPLTLTKSLTAQGVVVFLFANQFHDPAKIMAETPQGDFCTYVGTLFYKGTTGKQATAALLGDLDANGDDVFEDLFGNYCLILHHGGALRVLTDYSGLHHVYHRRDLKVISNSFISTACAVGRRTLTNQEIYEYIVHGATFGEPTLIRDVSRFDSEQEVRIAKSVATQIPRRNLWSRSSGSYKDLSIKEHLELALSVGRRYFAQIAASFGSNVTGALSGGFDSRLNLAFMRSHGINPQLFVYGAPSDSDVTISKEICSEEGLNLNCINRLDRAPLEPDAYWDNQESTFHGLDALTQYGYACDPTEFSHRSERVQGGLLAINGGSGEIWRNFWQLPDGHFSARELLRSFYDRVRQDVFTEQYNHEEFFGRLAEKACLSLGSPSGHLNRAEIESAYPRFRVRFWQGPNNSVDNGVGYAVTPFAEHQFAVPSMWIPIRYKQDGWFERQLLIQLSESLAKYRSGYGFDFLHGPRLKHKIKSRLVNSIPIYFRPILRRMIRPDAMPYYLGARYVAARFGRGPLEVENYVTLARIRDPLMYSRALTIERMLRDQWL